MVLVMVSYKAHPMPGSFILHVNLFRELLSPLPFYRRANRDGEEVLCSMSRTWDSDRDNG